MTPTPATRAHVLINANCDCGRMLDIPRPWQIGQAPVVVHCECGLDKLCSLELQWYIDRIVEDALARAPKFGF